MWNTLVFIPDCSVYCVPHVYILNYPAALYILLRRLCCHYHSQTPIMWYRSEIMWYLSDDLVERTLDEVGYKLDICKRDVKRGVRLTILARSPSTTSPPLPWHFSWTLPTPASLLSARTMFRLALIVKILLTKICKKLDLSFVPRSRLAFIVLCDIHLNPGPPSSILSSAAPICQRGQNHCDQNYWIIPIMMIIWSRSQSRPSP